MDDTDADKYVELGRHAMCKIEEVLETLEKYDQYKKDTTGNGEVTTINKSELLHTLLVYHNILRECYMKVNDIKRQTMQKPVDNTLKGTPKWPLLVT